VKIGRCAHRVGKDETPPASRTGCAWMLRERG
jgi:hypothetical protein